jgi:hypothetical protein
MRISGGLCHSNPYKKPRDLYLRAQHKIEDTCYIRGQVSPSWVQKIVVFGPSCSSEKKKNKNINEDSVVIRCSVRFIIDNHCVIIKLIISVNRLGELSLRCHAKLIMCLCKLSTWCSLRGGYAQRPNSSGSLALWRFGRPQHVKLSRCVMSEYRNRTKSVLTVVSPATTGQSHSSRCAH